VHKPKGVHIIVSGVVQVSATNKIAVLSEAKGPGNALILDLEVEETSDAGTQVVVWTPATFHREVETDQFNEVQVRWDGKTIAKFPVIDDRQHATLTATQQKAQNAVVGTVSRAKTAKKIVAKAKKVVTAVAKTVAGAAKKVAKAVASKKAAKKAAKKTTKKAVKKAAKTARRPAKKAAKRPAKKAKKAARKRGRR
jgi:hypothetical protein